MMRTIQMATLIAVLLLFGCSGGDPTAPPPDNPDMRVTVTRMNPAQPAIDTVKIIVTRLQDGTLAMPGRTIEIQASSGDVSLTTDRGDGTYEAVWTGDPSGEITIIATDTDSDPPVETGLTFLALEFLLTEWDVPVKLAYPVSTDGWDTAPCLYPDGNGLMFSYITIDMVSLAAGITRPIGTERPGQMIPQTLNIFIASPSDDNPSWWTGWTVEHAQCNLFQALPMHISAPTISGDGMSAFLTIQEYLGDSFGPTSIYSIDSDFQQTPVALGEPVDMAELGEDNPYYDSTHGWLYFDTYELDDPFSKQDIWVAQASGGGHFSTPVMVGGDIHTNDIETQAFVHEPSSVIYYASDREQEEYQLGIWRAPLYGDFTGMPEVVAQGELAIGKPSLTLDGEWLCFAYAREETGGANADIAMSRRME